jgi:hypothetical protein
MISESMGSREHIINMSSDHIGEVFDLLSLIRAIDQDAQSLG